MARADASDEASDKAPTKRRYGRWVLLLLLLVGVVLVYLGTRPPHIPPGSVLYLKLEGEVAEGPSENPLRSLGEAFGGGGAPSLHDLRRVLTSARDDARIRGVLLEIRPGSSGWATVEELRDLISTVREGGKPVHALLTGDFIQEREYSLAAAAGRVLTSPETGLLLNGLLAEVSFYRGVFDKLQVEPQFLQFKEYKSAAEPFINKSMSPAMREWVTAITSEAEERFVAQVAKARQVDAAQVKKLLQGGLLTSQEAVAAKLVDGVGYRDELEDALLPSQPGEKAEARKERVVPVGRYLRAIAKEPRRGRLALIYAVGPISAGGSGDGGFMRGDVIEGPRTAKALREAAEDDEVKAIVMRVNSPGGSAVGSDYIWREIERVKARKPVIISMGDVAGSGGYWISMGATHIVAQPSTLTGSIGVVYGHFNVLPPLAWAGLSVDTVKISENADLLSNYRTLTPPQLARISAWMQQVYDSFVGKVAAGRGLTPQVVEPLAHGRVWSGAQAKQRRLVDSLGGLTLALQIAREKASLPADTHPVLYPRQRGILGALAGAGDASTRAAADPAAYLRALAAELSTPRPQVMSPALHIR